MTLKTCTCGKINTTKNAVCIGRGEMLYVVIQFNCTGTLEKPCNSTFTIMKKEDQLDLQRRNEKRAQQQKAA